MSLQRPLPTETFCPSLNADREIQSEEIDLLSPTSVEGEGAGTGEAAPKTAAELRAEKRKMKRFRLANRLL